MRANSGDPRTAVQAEPWYSRRSEASNRMDAALIVLTVVFGAFTTIVFELARSLPTTVRWLKKLFPKRSRDWYDRMDFFVVWVLGSLAAYFVFQPLDPRQGFLSGLGRVSAIRLGVGKHQAGQPIGRAS